MLRQTFIHIPGIGPKTERALWKRGIRTWEEFLGYEGPVFSPPRDALIRKELEASLQHLSDARYFRDRLPPNETWRMFRRFEDAAVYLDIETSGGYEGMDEITVIGLYDGRNVRTFVNGANLKDFEIAIAEYRLVITFNGTCFDLPYIRRWFRNITLPDAHIDLRFLLKRLGYRGGLKKIETILGIGRPDGIAGMDGYDAVVLWRAFRQGDRQALERLIQYNTADIVNLAPLMEKAYAEMKDKLLAGVSPGLSGQRISPLQLGET